MAHKGRGALSNGEGRFEAFSRTGVEDGWFREADDGPGPGTTITAETARSIISRNSSPDVPFDRSMNPYRGCEHGCIYCFARPNHGYVNLSPGLDFETRLFYKHNAAQVLEATLRRPGYRCAPIVLGTSTDPYQPMDRRHRITRQLLEVLLRYRHPVSVITKGSHVLRDLDLYTALAGRGLVSVCVSLTSLDDGLKRLLEPRTASGRQRLEIMRGLSGAGVPVTVLVAPVIPAINDREMESLLQTAAEAGATGAGYVLLRLPHEVEPLFREWLRHHYPERAEHVMSLIRQCHEGRHYRSGFGIRQRGSGPFAELIARRFSLACRRAGLCRERRLALNTASFRVPALVADHPQMALPI